jgi:hypothetical protein
MIAAVEQRVKDDAALHRYGQIALMADRLQEFQLFLLLILRILQITVFPKNAGAMRSAPAIHLIILSLLRRRHTQPLGDILAAP